jgi:hypothetical protein
MLFREILDVYYAIYWKQMKRVDKTQISLNLCI